MEEESKRRTTIKKVKRRLTVEEPTPDDQGWLISYADMMTLIACFFILMTAFANYDPKTFGLKTKMLADHFSGQKKFKQKEDTSRELQEAIKKDTEMAKHTDVAVTDEGLKITFSGSSLFKGGSAEIRPDMKETLGVMIELIQIKNPQFRIVIGGHSDSAPLRNSVKYRSNWDLSGSRAARVAEEFEKYGFEKSQLVSVGHGSTRPVAPDYDKNGNALFENMALNRRVVIKVLRPINDLAKKKLGLGVFFNDQEIVGKSPGQEVKSSGTLKQVIPGENIQAPSPSVEVKGLDIPDDPLLE